MVVVSNYVVDIRRGGNSLSLALEHLEDLRFAFVGAGPFAVTSDMPNDVVGHVFFHPVHVTLLESLKTLSNEPDIGMLVMRHFLLLSPSLPRTYTLAIFRMGGGELPTTLASRTEVGKGL
jgi:hypothetical protein